MKKMIFAIVIAVVTVSALEPIKRVIVSEECEGMIYKNGRWVYVPVVEVVDTTISDSTIIVASVGQ